MRPTLFLAPLAILLLDAIPQSVERDSSETSYRLSVGMSAGRYEEKNFDCDGNLVDVTPIDVRSGGARLDVMGTQGRLSVCAGRISSDTGKRQRMDGSDEEWPADPESQYEGFFGGMQIAAEREKFGLGLGMTAVQGDTNQDDLIAPSAYLRFGDLDRAHVRIEAFPPSEILVNTPGLSAGVGYNQGSREGMRAYVGVGFWPYSYEDELAPRLAAACDVPVTSNVDLLVRAQVGYGELSTLGSVGAGLAIRF